MASSVSTAIKVENNSSNETDFNPLKNDYSYNKLLFEAQNNAVTVLAVILIIFLILVIILINHFIFCLCKPLKCSKKDSLCLILNRELKEDKKYRKSGGNLLENKRRRMIKLIVIKRIFI